ncbi:MAG: hypothetical protein VKN33_00255 [Candidatus Sericytochromatia bacterium]|nr:hypothetical protein [Candidatus Sericytochromatia bacterium]
MRVAAQVFLAQVEAAFSHSPRLGEKPSDVERATVMMAEGANDSQGLIEMERDDILSLLADVPSRTWDVQFFETNEHRGTPLSLASWLHAVRYAIVEVAGGPDLTLHEVSDAAEQLYGVLPSDVEVVFGAVIRAELVGRLQLRLVAIQPTAEGD